MGGDVKRHLDTIIERLAKRIYEATVARQHVPWETLNRFSRGIADEFRTQARAALDEIHKIERGE